MIITIKDKLNIGVFNQFYKDKTKRKGLLTIQQIDTENNPNNQLFYNFKTKKLIKDTNGYTGLQTDTDQTITLELPNGYYLAKFNIVGFDVRSVTLKIEG